MARTFEERFWDKIDRRSPDECWLWTAACDRDGYGHIDQDGRLRLAHRVAWERVNGPIPSGMCVCHRCDVPACVNPAHLFLGTHAENMSDCAKKKRTLRGYARAKLNRGIMRDLVMRGVMPTQKLSRQHVEQIKYLLSVGATGARLARHFGVNHRAISDIKNSRTWADVPCPPSQG